MYLPELLGRNLIGGNAETGNRRRPSCAGATPVRNVAAARAWSPGPSPSARPLTCASPLNTFDLLAERLERLHRRAELEVGARGLWRPEERARALVARADDAVGRIDVAQARPASPPAASAASVNAGTIESSSGSAIAAPRPRRKVRRGRGLLKMIMSSTSSSSETVCCSRPPAISDEIRNCRFAASRAIARTAGCVVILDAAARAHRSAVSRSPSARNRPGIW